MTKRDIIGEIEGVRDRNGTNSYRYESSDRLIELGIAFKNYYEIPYELKKYVPVALSACIEGFVRGIVKELCDSDTKYLERAFKNGKLDLSIEYVIAIQNQRVTPGDIVSHVASISSLESIERILGPILNCKILSELSNYEITYTNGDKESKKTYLENSAEVLKWLKVFLNSGTYLRTKSMPKI